MSGLEHVATLLREALPGADVVVHDLGGGDHLAVQVKAPQFAGKSRIEQHQMIYAPLEPLLKDQTVHALQITASPL